MTEEIHLTGMACDFAQAKEGGGVFWRHGILVNQDSTHFYFEVNGQLQAFLKSQVVRIEFKSQQGARC